MNDGGDTQNQSMTEPGAEPNDAADATTAVELRAAVIDVLLDIYDPEIPVSIYELGLVYTVDVGEDGKIDIDMTLTSPACPVAGTLPVEVQERVRLIEGVRDCDVNIVWDPPWHPGLMSEAAKLSLGMF
jgi:FeS assembly SUF system protein